MLLMNFLVLPPEVNSWRMFSGAGSGSLLAAASGWDGLAEELRSAAGSFWSVTTGLSGGAWQGAASAAMGEVAAGYVARLAAAASHGERMAVQARVTAQAFETAFTATVHPAAVAANRAQLVSLVESNIFGQNASVIAEAEADYERMWAQDVSAMAAYHSEASQVQAQLVSWRQSLLSAVGLQANSLSSSIAASSSGSSGSSSVAGETRLTLAMNSPLYSPKFLQELQGLTAPQYAALTAETGENWFPGTISKTVNYPATAGIINGVTALTADKAILIGQQRLNTAILSDTSNGQSVVVAGLSEGTMVIDAEEAYLATAANAPSPSQVTFVEFSNPQRGLADTYLPAGFKIPLAGYTVHEAPVSQYNTDVVYSQYEGWSDPPDRPWHLLSDVNAVAGMVYEHIPTEFASMSDTVEVSSVTNSLGGTTTTYMVPESTLPLLMPLQQLGVPASIVAHLNSTLTPIVNEGFSQYDPTGGAYFSQGHLVW
jgi:PPE family/PE-PPE domain